MDTPGHRKTGMDRQSIMDVLIGRTMAVNRHELRALGWAFSYFFALLSSYYIIRPMRDEMGIAGGVEHLQWMFTGSTQRSPSTLPSAPLGVTPHRIGPPKAPWEAVSLPALAWSCTHRIWPESAC